MSTLSHLSPDVLEVVRDVASQEDSFLLRAQGVPLRAFTGENAPRIGPRAAFLSSAERHMLQYCRDETAYLFELALYFKLLREARPDAILNRAELTGDFASAFAVVGMPRASFSTYVPPMSSLAAELKAPDDMLGFDWRTLAKFAMSLRVKTTTLSNVALGWLRGGAIDESRETLQRAHVLRPGYSAEYFGILGFERFLRGASDDSARAYTSAWRISNDDAHGACALLNLWLTRSKLDSDLEAFVRSLEGARFSSVASWLRKAVRSSLNRAFAARLVEDARAMMPERRGHPSDALIREALQ